MCVCVCAMQRYTHKSLIIYLYHYICKYVELYKVQCTHEKTCVIYVYVYVYIYMCICIYIYVYIYICEPYIHEQICLIFTNGLLEYAAQCRTSRFAGSGLELPVSPGQGNRP